MKFNYSIKTLNEELVRLWSAGEGLPSNQFEKTNIYKRILEIKAATGLLERYDFKLKEG